MKMTRREHATSKIRFIESLCYLTFRTLLKRYSVTLGDPENILEYLLETRILCKIDDVAGKLNNSFHSI